MGRLDRRTAIQHIMLGSMAASSLPSIAAMPNPAPTSLKGNIRHAVCRWCYNGIPLDEFCHATRQMGISAIDLVGPKDWPTLQKHGLHSSMCNGAEINLTDGWNDTRFHETLVRNYTEMIPLVAKAGYTNLICFSGNRRGKDDETGWKNCSEGLKKIMGIAEKHHVLIVMELLNSRVDHADYQCDHTAWGVELVKRIGSPNFKLLYDIYHMQIDEGDVIRTIQNNHTHIAHYHTGGVPGRHEIDHTQELNYPAIMQAIVNTGFTGFVAQEFIPSWPDKLAALRKGIEICDV
jgi:hydroxypyruvate isomerase